MFFDDKEFGGRMYTKEIMVNRYVGNNDIKYVFRIYRVSEELYNSFHTITLKAAAATMLASQYAIAA